MCRYLQKALDWFYYSRKFVLDCIAFASIRLCGIESTFEDVRNHTYKAAEYADLDLANDENVESLLTVARDTYKSAQDRRAHVTDKCKTLQGMSAFLLTIIGLFLAKVFDCDSMCMRILFYCAVLLLLNAVTLLLVYFAVGGEAVVVVDQQKAGMAGNVLKKWLINEYGRCTASMDNKTNYLVDLYRVARFFFLFAFTLIVVLFSITYFGRTGSTDVEKFVRQLRGDPKVIELLRGPKGDKGDTGNTGGKGDKGDKGNQGEKPTVDVNQLVSQLLSDPRTRKLMEEVHEAASQKAASSTNP